MKIKTILFSNIILMSSLYSFSFLNNQTVIQPIKNTNTDENLCLAVEKMSSYCNQSVYLEEICTQDDLDFELTDIIEEHKLQKNLVLFKVECKIKEFKWKNKFSNNSNIIKDKKVTLKCIYDTENNTKTILVYDKNGDLYPYSPKKDKLETLILDKGAIIYHTDIKK
jgi:hypothetical protein